MPSFEQLVVTATDVQAEYEVGKGMYLETGLPELKFLLSHL